MPPRKLAFPQQQPASSPRTSAQGTPRGTPRQRRPPKGSLPAPTGRSTRPPTELALEEAVAPLQVLGWPSEEWSSLDPTAQEAETLRAADELSRKTTVFELMLRSHLAEHGARLGAPTLSSLFPAAVVRSHRRSRP